MVLRCRLGVPPINLPHEHPGALSFDDHMDVAMLLVAVQDHRVSVCDASRRVGQGSTDFCEYGDGLLENG